MTAYIRFCSRQLSAAKFLQQLTEESPEFRNTVKQCQSDPRTNGMPLSSFLIKPMQRITKYPLLIKKVSMYCLTEELTLSQPNLIPSVIMVTLVSGKVFTHNSATG
jgi:hypothetical protein